MTGQLKLYNIGNLTKKQRNQLKKDLRAWIEPLIPVVLDEALDEIIDKMKDITFSGNETFTLNFPFSICGNDLLAQIGKRKWRL